MYTLHAVMNHRPKEMTYDGLIIASIAYNLLRADGWDVKMYGPDGVACNPLALNEFLVIPKSRQALRPSSV